MARKAPIPRRPSGVQVKVGKSTRNADTRDARDDATIISWLQRIDMDVLRGSKQPFVSPSASPKGETPQTTDPVVQKSQKLATEVERVGASAVAFNRAFESARNAVIGLATAFNPSTWVGMVAGVKDAIRILSLAPRATPAAASTDEETSQSGAKAKKPRPPVDDSPVRRIGDALRGTDATKEFSWTQVRQGMGGAMPPPIRNPAILNAMKGANPNIFNPFAQAMAGSAAPSFTPAMASAAASTAPRVALASAAAGTGAGGGSFIGGLAGGVALGTAGGVAAAIAAIGAVAVAFAVLPPIMAKFGQSVFDANRQFSASGAMAAVIAQQNVRDVLRNMSTGNQTARSASVLGNSLGSLKDDLQPLVVLVRNTINLLTAGLLKVTSFFVNLPIFAGKSMKEIMQALNKIVDNTLPQVDGESMGEWLDNVARMGAERKSGFRRPFAEPGTTKSRVGPWMGGSTTGEFS